MDRQYRDQDQDQSQASWDTEDQAGYEDQQDEQDQGGMQAARQNIGQQRSGPAQRGYAQGQGGYQDQQGQDAYVHDQDQPQGGYDQDQPQRGYTSQDQEDQDPYDDQGQNY
jgi:hypothetical protein